MWLRKSMIDLLPHRWFVTDLWRAEVCILMKLWEVVDWFHLANDGNFGRALVNTAMNQFPWKVENT
jgi:hypothetical protein